MRTNVSVGRPIGITLSFLFPCALALCAASRCGADVRFADYVPLTAAQHGVKTFEWTYGRVGQFTSQIGGTRAIHYGDGTTLVGTELINLGEPGVIGLGYNDGTVVKILGTTEFYFSSDSKLTSHPSAWSFGSVADGMVIDQRGSCRVRYDRSSWSREFNQLLLFEIQDVTVLQGTYSNAIIIWCLDAQYPFAYLNLAGTGSRLGILPPTAQETRGYSVTGFDIYGLNTGLVASGDIDAQSGDLVELAELQKVERPFATADLAGAWWAHGIVVGQQANQRPGWFHCEITFDSNGRATWSPIVASDGSQDYIPEPGTWAVDPSGVVSVPRVASFHGIMSPKRDRIVAVATMAPGRQSSLQGDNLIIMQKRSGVVFATSDLAGTWSMHAVSDPPSQAVWMHGDMTIDPNGMFLEVPGCSRDSTGYSPGTGNGGMSLAPDGVLMGTPLPFIHDLHATVSDSKDLVVVTLTDTHVTPIVVHGLGTIQRRSDSPFVKGDLSGQWRICGLTTQSGRWSNWAHGTWTVDADGSSDGQLYKSDGTTGSLGGMVTVANYGVFRIDPFTYTHGVIGADRDLMVLVTTDSRNEHQMLIGTRTSTTPAGPVPCQCEDDDPANGIYRICNYWPLHPGNQWIYTTGDYTVLNETYTSSYGWSAVRFATGTYEYDSFIYQSCEDGLAGVARYDRCDGEFYEFDPPMMLMPPEMRVGESVTKTYTWPDSPVIRFTTTFVGPESVTVPAGKFTALRFDVDVDDAGQCAFTTRLWLAKNVGMVKFQRVSASPANCLGCMFTCRCDDDLTLVNAPAELVSAVVDGKRY